MCFFLLNLYWIGLHVTAVLKLQVKKLFFILLYFSFLKIGKDRSLIEQVCFCPVKLFTKKSLEDAIACWEWLLVARKDLEDEVKRVS